MNLGRLEGHLEEQADAQTGIAKKEEKKNCFDHGQSLWLYHIASVVEANDNLVWRNKEELHLQMPETHSNPRRQTLSLQKRTLKIGNHSWSSRHCVKSK